MASTKDGAKALRAMNDTVKAGDSPFSFIGAEPMFRGVMKAYFSKMCTPEMIEERADRIVEEFIGNGAEPQVLARLRPGLRDHIRSHRTLFDEVRARYFSTDLCPEHDQRFQTSFEQCGPPAS